MTKYILLVGSYQDHHSGWSALGHEIHLSRFLLLDMLNCKYINNDNIIVTSNKDRYFLYSKLFHKVIDLNTFHNLQPSLDDKNILNLWNFNYSIVKDIPQNNILDFESKCNYPIRKKLYDHFELNFDNLISEIDYPPIPATLIPTKKFIVIHFRSIIDKTFINNIDNNYENLILIMNKLKDKYPNLDIYIYSIQPILLDYFNEYVEKYKNVKIVDNLSIYSSLMNHEYCQAVFSELSGGGELSQYCHNKRIFIYGNNYGIQEDNSIIKRGKKCHDEWNSHSTTKAINTRYTDILSVLDNLII